MPKIPVYQQQVGPADMPGVRLGTNYTPDMFDGGMAQGMKAVSGALQDVNTAAGNILKKKNAIWVQERLSKLTQQYDTFTYGSPDGQVSGVLTSKGLAAAEAARTAPEFLDKAVSDLTGDAPSQDAVTEFRLRAAAVRQSTSSTIARHAATEVNLYHAEAAQGNAQVQIESIAADYNQSPEAIDQAIMDRVAPSILEAARLTGKPTEEAMREAKASTYALVITQTLASGNTRRAKELLGREDWHDALDAETRAKLTDKIRTETIKLDADDKATKLAGEMMSGRSYSDILSEINGIEDRDMKVATRSAFRAMATQIRYDMRQAEQEASMNAVLQLDTLGGDLKAQYDYVNNMPEGKAKKHALVRYKQYAAAEGRNFMTDPGKFDALIDKISFAEIRSEQELLSDPDAAHVAASDLKALKSDLAIKQGAKGITSGEYKEAYLRASGDETVRNKQDLLAFLEFARNKLTESNRGDDPTYVQNLADMWFLKGEKKGSGWGYGSDKEFREALADPTWIPDAISDHDPRSSNRMALTNSMVKDIIRQGKAGNVDGWAEYLKDADGDEKLAARMSWGNYLKKNLLGPRTRSK